MIETDDSYQIMILLGERNYGDIKTAENFYRSCRI